MGDPVVGIEDAPETRVVWSGGIPHCPNPECGKALDSLGTVAFTERYDAHISDGPFGICVVRANTDFSTEACCSACGAQLDYEDVT